MMEPAVITLMGSAAPPHSTQRTASSAGPPVIRKLDENVVNKIAAGEVIQRPASALKEMLENSLDAGATQISVLVKEGGNKLLQITDNGCGVRKEDLPILCHRHTTSKLREFEDLETISTLGFRGEALCSISFVSHMTVTTMARGAQYGYRVMFKDSEMEPPGPRPVAAVPGTTITVEDLFYNVPTRRKALKSASEEYGLILDVVGRYAVYSTGVAFTCRRQGDSRSDISTSSTGSRLDAVRAVYGTDVARELLPLKLEMGSGTGPEVPVDGPLGLSVQGLISGANYSTGKKTVLVLFINGRCVECSPMRRALEGLYGTLLPKASRPWLFLDVRLPPRQVEVNMHPTKREVGFMHQLEVIEEIRRAVEAKLLASNESRTFATTATLQTQLPFASLQLTQQQQQEPSESVQGVSGENEQEGNEEEEEAGEDVDAEEREEVWKLKRRLRQSQRAAAGQGLSKRSAGGAAPVPYRPEKLVRVDYRAGTLDTFVITDTSTNHHAGAARAAAAGGNLVRRRSAAARLSDSGALLDSAVPGLGPTSQRQQQGGRGRPPALVTAEVLGLGPLVQLAPLEGDEDQATSGGGDHEGGGARGPRAPPRRAPPAVVTSDPSVLELLAEVEANGHLGLVDLLREHTFVGVADGSLALLQHGTRLYLVDVGTLSRDMFFQLALRRWERPLRLTLEPPPLVSELVALGLQLLQVKGEWQPEDGSPKELGELVTELLQQNATVLEQQLGLVVDEQGRLVSVPLLLEDVLPDPARLSDLVVALAKDVDWDDPWQRARGLATALADLYAARPPLLPEDEAEGEETGQGCSRGSAGAETSGQATNETETAGAAARGNATCTIGQGGEQAQPSSEALGDSGAGLSGRDGRTAGDGSCLAGTVGGSRGDASSSGGVLGMFGRRAEEVEGGTEGQGGSGSGGRVGAGAGSGPAVPAELKASVRAIAGSEAGPLLGRAAAAGSESRQVDREQRLAAYEFKIRNVILPAMRGCVRPPKERATDGSCVQVAALERLYRIFERC